MKESNSDFPFVDLYSQYLSLKGEIDNAIQNVITKSAFIRGSYVDAFEKDFSEITNSTHCISCANGTDALYISLKALGLDTNDEVIVPAHSWISTSETVTQAGGKVVFCDTDADTFTIDPNTIEDKITDKTVGIIPVHLFGQAADMAPIMKIAQKYNLWVLEDCAQAHLAKYKDKQVGSFGDAATFSFYPGKNLGAMGDAGAIITDSEDLAKKMTMFSRHGGLSKGDHQIEGINSRMDGLQAAILSVKLKYLKKWTYLRQGIASIYNEQLVKISQITCPKTAKDRDHVWHLYVIKTKQRDELKKFLYTKGVPTVINYPVALPFLPAYSRYNHKFEEFPNAYSNQSSILSLPLYPEMSDKKIGKVIKELKKFYS
jgi:dTDP-4-amino-4,6-dideoxygalactose transaminase